jgi:ribose 5-phosphate isomerase B
MTMRTIFFGSDHAGFSLKQTLVSLLTARGLKVEDLGPHSTDSVDYPDYAHAVCKRVVEEGGLGILVCGSGLGMSMAANKTAGIRAALCLNEYLARMARRHNNANVLCLGARVVGQDLAEAVTDAFLEAEFEGGRHQRRVDMIEGPCGS